MRATDFLRLLSARLVRVLATVGLTISVSLKGLGLRWPLVAVFATAIVANEVVNFFRERSTRHRPGRHYEIVQRRLLRLVCDLADYAGGNLRLWSVDVYLRQYSFGFSIQTFRVVTFVREHTLTLTDAPALPPEIEGENLLFSKCYSATQSRLWWNEQLAGPASGENQWDSLSAADNNQLQDKHGVISLNPVVDHLGHKCRGLLVIHVKADSEIAITALGVLSRSAGQRRIAEACHDIHRKMSRSGERA